MASKMLPEQGQNRADRWNWQQELSGGCLEQHHLSREVNEKDVTSQLLVCSKRALSVFLSLSLFRRNTNEGNF
jgi:hypothetical protein